MTEINDSRPWTIKGDLAGSFSDADSGYDDPGVLTIPVVRTLFHNDPTGRKISTTSTEWISVQRKNDQNEIKYDYSTSPNGSREGLSETLTLQRNSSQNLGQGSESTLSIEDSDQTTNSPEIPTKSLTKIPLGMNITMETCDVDDFDIARFEKEHKKEKETERRSRFLSAPRDRKGKPIPTIRDIHTSHVLSVKEETFQKVPRRRFRSKSADGKRRVTGPQSLFSPTYSKVLSPETMRKRRMWSDLLKKDCILEEEYYKVPYEACNKEIMLGRYSSPEALLYNFKRLKKEQCRDKVSEQTLTNKTLKNIENKSDPLKILYGGNKYDDVKYIESLIYNKNQDRNLIGMFNLEDKLSPKVIYRSKPQTATDQLQQLINDLNQIAFSDLKTNFEKEKSLDLLQNNSKVGSIEPKYTHIKDFNENVADSLNAKSEIPISDEISGKEINSKQKLKPRKKVSFSQENEEMVFDSNFSDSESSVFEDKIEESEGWHSNTGEKEPCASSLFEKVTSHDPFVTNSITPHDLRALDSGEKINKNNLISLNSRTVNETINAKSPSSRYSQPYSSPDFIQRKTEANSEINRLPKRFFAKEEAPNNKNDYMFNDSSFPSNYTFYNSLPYKNREENANQTKKKTSQINGDLRTDKINIYMTKGPSFAEHEIYFSTISSSQNPYVSISRVRVPFSSIRDQWQWALYLQQEASKHKKKSSPTVYSPYSYSPSPTPMSISSPTPSCESSGSLCEHSSTTSGCSDVMCSPPLSPFVRSKGLLPTAL